MSDRLKTMQRIATLQAQQKRLAEWKLAVIVQRKAALDSAQAELGRFVADGELVGRFASEAILQSQRLARRTAQAEQQQRVQADAVREAERRLKLTERTVEQLAAEDRTLRERRSLEALIDTLADRPPASIT